MKYEKPIVPHDIKNVQINRAKQVLNWTNFEIKYQFLKKIDFFPKSKNIIALDVRNFTNAGIHQKDLIGVIWNIGNYSKKFEIKQKIDNSFNFQKNLKFLEKKNPRNILVYF